MALELPPGEFHLWTVFTETVTDADLLRHCETLLSAEETVRYQRFHFAKHRRQFLISHAFVRTVLARYAGAPAAALRFVVGQHGKPDLVDGGDLRFNLSHTAGLAALAVVRGHDIGVDVEHRERRTVGIELAERYFAPAEVAQLHALDEVQRQEAFFAFWTLKEAYIKARGLGLALPLDAFAYTLAGGRTTITFSERIADDPGAWQFVRLRPGQAHDLAVAIHRSTGVDLTPVVRTSWPDGFYGS